MLLWFSERLSLAGVALGGFLAWNQEPFVVLVLVVPTVLVFGRGFVQGLWLKKYPRMGPRAMAWSLGAMDLSFGNIMWVLERLWGVFARVLPFLNKPSDEGAVEKEVMDLVEKGRQEGALETEEHKLIHKVLEFGDREVSRIMTPRPDMFCLPADTSIDVAAEEAAKAGYSRIPVYESSKDNIVGILFAKDLLALKLPQPVQNKSIRVKDLARPAFFVPLTMEVGELLRELRSKKLHMAVCVDEFGAVAGLVTLEDVLEELFGEIYDEYDLEIRRWEPLGRESYIVTGKMSIHELEELLGVKVVEHGCNTVAGLVLKALGHFPSPGETACIGGLLLEVEKVDKTRILAVKVRREKSEGCCGS